MTTTSVPRWVKTSGSSDDRCLFAILTDQTAPRRPTFILSFHCYDDADVDFWIPVARALSEVREDLLSARVDVRTTLYSTRPAVNTLPSALESECGLGPSDALVQRITEIQGEKVSLPTFPATAALP